MSGNVDTNIGRLDPPSDEQQNLARLTAAHFAESPEDLELLLRVLGLLDDDTPRRRRRVRTGAAPTMNPGHCTSCKVAMGSRTDPEWGGTFYGGLGRCERCYQIMRRARNRGSVS